MSASKAQQLDYIASLAAPCQLCPLYKSATRSVPGAGSPEAKIMFIGEAPGFHEDQQGLPFVGNSGKLLDKLLAEINLARSEVFVGNIVKHRPPENRDPLPNEIAACVPYLKAQIKIIKPKIIITLGRFAMNFFFPEAKIGQLRGQIKEIKWQGLDLTVIPVYHPSAALRNGTMLSALKQDFFNIGQFLGKH